YLMNTMRMLRRVYPGKRMNIILLSRDDMPLMMSRAEWREQEKRIGELHYYKKWEYTTREQFRVILLNEILVGTTWLEETAKHVGKDGFFLLYAPDAGQDYDEQRIMPLMNYLFLEWKIKGLMLYDFGTEKANPSQISSGFSPFNTGFGPYSREFLEKIERRPKTPEELYARKSAALDRILSLLPYEVRSKDALVDADWGFVYSRGFFLFGRRYFYPLEEALKSDEYAGKKNIVIFLKREPAGYEIEDYSTLIEKLGYNYYEIPFQTIFDFLHIPSRETGHRVSVISFTDRLEQELFDELMILSDELPSYIGGPNTLFNIVNLSQQTGRRWFWEAQGWQGQAKEDFRDLLSDEGLQVSKEDREVILGAFDGNAADIAAIFSRSTRCAEAYRHLSRLIAANDFQKGLQDKIRAVLRGDIQPYSGGWSGTVRFKVTEENRGDGGLRDPGRTGNYAYDGGEEYILKTGPPETAQEVPHVVLSFPNPPSDMSVILLRSFLLPIFDKPLPPFHSPWQVKRVRAAACNSQSCPVCSDGGSSFDAKQVERAIFNLESDFIARYLSWKMKMNIPKVMKTLRSESYAPGVDSPYEMAMRALRSEEKEIKSFTGDSVAACTLSPWELFVRIEGLTRLRRHIEFRRYTAAMYLKEFGYAVDHELDESLDDPETLSGMPSVIKFFRDWSMAATYPGIFALENQYKEILRERIDADLGIVKTILRAWYEQGLDFYDFNLDWLLGINVDEMEKSLVQREYFSYANELYYYEGTPFNVIRLLLQDLGLTGDDVLNDLGCGPGRLLIASMILTPLKRASGIEMIAERAGVCKDIVDKLGLDQVTVVRGNIRDVELDAESTVFYLFNPFSPGALTVAIEKLKKAAAARRIKVAALGLRVNARLL
ncbi:MAG: hypothetical protein PHC33_01295, partial [Candidatus Omnitrophica bacterium]|nr:hypothetical protein [Candidatus Omnitrophota bacterium]